MHSVSVSAAEKSDSCFVLETNPKLKPILNELGLNVAV